jgi:M-phase inducer tyrosine phosphatase
MSETLKSPTSNNRILRRTHSLNSKPESFVQLASIPPTFAEVQYKPILPCLDIGKDAINRISPETVCDLIEGRYDDQIDEYYIIDCRFPYEYEGGHIIGALNINNMDELNNMFFRNPPDTGKKCVIVFHCEFSSHRAPRMALHLRGEDRIRNKLNYPNLYYPDIYILHEGYKGFFKTHQVIWSFDVHSSENAFLNSI